VKWKILLNRHCELRLRVKLRSNIFHNIVFNVAKILLLHAIKLSDICNSDCSPLYFNEYLN
jgi:hypothetical protein